MPAVLARLFCLFNPKRNLTVFWRDFFSLRLLLLLILAFFPTASNAQYRFDRWTTDNGLPQNTIRDIVQTRDGYLWLTTFDGLARFDGVRFTVFDKGNTRGLSSNRFTALYEGKDGTLYAGTEGSGLITYSKGGFASHLPADGFPGRAILRFRQTPEGETLIDTENESFYMREGKGIPAPAEYQSKQRQTNFYLSPSGTLWTADRNGVNQRRGEQVIYYPFKFDCPDIVTDVKFYEDGVGNLWVGTLSGLYRLKDGGVTRYAEKDGLRPGVFMRPYCEDNEGGIWFATGRVRDSDNGLTRFKDGRFTSYGLESGFPKTDIGQIIRDREGTIWVGTSSGLYRAQKQFITSYSTEQGLINREVYPLFERRNGDILIGTPRWISRFHNNRFTTLPLRQQRYDYVQAFWEDQSGRLWIGVVGGLLWYENGQIKNVSALISAPNTVWAIRPDRRGNIWVATIKGLFKVNNDVVTAYYDTEDGLPSADVKVIHEGRDGALWFGTYGGLARFQDGKFTSWTAKDGLASDRVRSIYEDSDGTLWIGTYDGGLSRFRDGRFFNYTIETGLFNNGVFCILEDRRSNFWISCNRGIYRINRHELNNFADGLTAQIHCIAYGKPDGMRNTECNGGRQPAGLITTDGKMWFPTQEGVVIVDPDEVTVNPLAPPVEIESVAIDRAGVAPSDSVQVSPSQTTLDINYTALSLIKSDLIRFRYKMEGLDANWVDVGSRRTAYYSYLPPGEYTFKVIAANSDGVWNSEGKSIKVRIIPPVYRRLWFIALASACALGLLFLAYRYRVSQLERARAAHQAFSRQLIASQEEERKRIAGELHDSLGQVLLVIKNRAYMGASAADNRNATREQFDEISDSAAEAINQVREISYYLRPSQLERFGLTAAIEEMLEQVTESSGISFDFEIADLEGAFSPEAEINFYRIVQECANNIVKHSGATGARVVISRNGPALDLTIHDNGKGFDTNAPAANGSGKSGFGLTGIAERARILGGVSAIESSPGSGATVRVRIGPGKTEVEERRHDRQRSDNTDGR